MFSTVRFVSFSSLTLGFFFSKNAKLSNIFSFLQGIYLFLVDEECPIGYAGKLPSCHDIDRFIDTFNFRHLKIELTHAAVWRSNDIPGHTALMQLVACVGFY